MSGWITFFRRWIRYGFYCIFILVWCLVVVVWKVFIKWEFYEAKMKCQYCGNDSGIKDNRGGCISFDRLSRSSRGCRLTFPGNRSWPGWWSGIACPLILARVGSNRKWCARRGVFLKICSGCTRGELRELAPEHLQLRLRVGYFVIIILSFEFSYLAV